MPALLQVRTHSGGASVKARSGDSIRLNRIWPAIFPSCSATMDGTVSPDRRRALARPPGLSSPNARRRSLRTGFEFHATGATAFYDGSRFARDGVVCVTINYRVGAEGFLYLADGIANLGLLDQIAALEWVRENIATFGGDPSKVTIFGESAGGMSVATLLTMPRAKGLFRRAIIQNGNTPNVTSAATAARIAKRLAEKLGVPATRRAIAAIAPERVLQAQAQLRDDLQARPEPVFWGEVALTHLPWAPAVDGQTIPQPPIDCIRAGVAADIDLLIGSNTEETRLFLLSDGTIDHFTGEALVAMAATYGLPAEGWGAYRAAHPGASAGELFSAIQTDWYWAPPRRQAGRRPRMQCPRRHLYV